MIAVPAHECEAHAMVSTAPPPPAPRNWVINYTKLRELVAKLERMADHPSATPEERKEATRLARNG